MAAMIFIVGIVIVMFCLSLVICKGTEEFPKHYHPACFDCRKSGKSCVTCPFHTIRSIKH